MKEEEGNETHVDSLEEDLRIRRLECLSNINNSVPVSGLHCEGVFDGWSCWPATPAGLTAYAPCPHFITGFDPNRLAHKECTQNGTWFRHPESGRFWSNYTTCVNLDDLNLRVQVNGIYQTGYFFSLLALLMSIFILSHFNNPDGLAPFCTVKEGGALDQSYTTGRIASIGSLCHSLISSLRCPRNTLHMNLFTSFAFNNFFWLLWYRLVIPNPEVIVENTFWCQFLHIVLHYFMLSSYTWMLAEGLYLHTLLVSAFTSEQKLVKILMATSWVIPLFFDILYVILRIAYGETEQCWIDESDPSRTVLVVLVATSMVMNLVFLCNIVRVVVIKLRAGPGDNHRPSSALLQALRAVLLLLPLLGINYLLMPFRPPHHHPWESTYEIISAITASFQGLFVATLFCFCNGEVITQLKRKWQYATFRPRANSYTTTTVSFVRSTAAPIAEEENV